MSKRGENIYKRKDGRWEGRYKKGRNKEGRIVYGYVYGKQYNEAKEKLSKKNVDYSMYGETAVQEEMMVDEWLNYWLNILMKNRIKPSTYSNYRGRINRHLAPFFKNKPLSELETADIDRFIYSLYLSDLSSNTIRSIISMLRSALKKAVNDNRISKNPCQGVLLPALTKPKIKSLDRKQQKKLEQISLYKKECSAEIIALYTGMRIGEISGLKWEDIDFKHNKIFVKRTISRIPSVTEPNKTEIIIGKPKSINGERAIPISKNLKRYLLAKKQKSTSVFVISCKNSFTEPRIINYRFKKVVEESKIGSVHFHALRHTFATRCVESGIDIATLSKILGHASTKMTLDIYTDSLWETRRSAMMVIDRQLNYDEKILL
ncbi:site-specific integrase [Candidatus Enterococcus lemimoniae]|uniref:Site-specific integrase n=1 Tax=Candidatus Enterococcus lemimoniae TaxID=1834167 RepID=A0ABZ2T9V1_9ENTE|nr:site-specific integrase [Enterococcus sp. 12C11_DIV0727]OTO69925.1 hypothetical protein A5866_002143 [Enterococcus sp. 12C11_DIV0727]